MSEPERNGSAEVEALKTEVARLTKVVDALMDRVEASASVQGSDFGLFQTTILLQDQVRLHTEELEAALGSPETQGEGQAAAARDMQTLRRTAALQIQLLELVVQQKDVAELIERVGAILDMPIVLFDARGRVVACSRAAAALPDLAPRLWKAYAGVHGADGGAVSVTGSGERVLFREVQVMGHAERVLAAATTLPRPSELAGASLLFLQQLVTLDLLRGKDELRMRRRLRRGLLRDVLSGDGPADKLRIRLQEQGFDDESLLRIAVVQPWARAARASRRPARAEQRSSQLLAALDTVLSLRRLPYLTSSKGESAVVLAALPDADVATARTLLAELRDAALGVSPEGAVAGCSSPLTGFGVAARGLQQAKAACISARHTEQPGGTAVFEELSGHFRLLDALDEAELDGIVQRTFAPLLEYDARHRASLYKTLATYFDHRLAVQETADALHIHRNTLQKRLANVEQLLGIDLGDLDAVVDVRLGLHAAELLGGPAA